MISRCSLFLGATHEIDDDIVTLSALTLQSLLASQCMDPWSSKNIGQTLNPAGINSDTKSRRKIRDYNVENNLLYKGNNASGGGRWLVVIYRNHRQEGLGACHDHQTAGYLRVHRTYCCLHLRYFWLGMYRDFKKYV